MVIRGLINKFPVVAFGICVLVIIGIFTSAKIFNVQLNFIIVSLLFLCFYEVVKWIVGNSLPPANTLNVHLCLTVSFLWGASLGLSFLISAGTIGLPVTSEIVVWGITGYVLYLSGWALILVKFHFTIDKNRSRSENRNPSNSLIIFSMASMLIIYYIATSLPVGSDSGMINQHIPLLYFWANSLKWFYLFYAMITFYGAISFKKSTMLLGIFFSVIIYLLLLIGQTNAFSIQGLRHDTFFGVPFLLCVVVSIRNSATYLMVSLMKRSETTVK